MSRQTIGCVWQGGPPPKCMPTPREPQRKTSKNFIDLRLRLSPRKTASKNRRSALPKAGRFGVAVPHVSKEGQVNICMKKNVIGRLRMQRRSALLRRC